MVGRRLLSILLIDRSSEEGSSVLSLSQSNLLYSAHVNVLARSTTLAMLPSSFDVHLWHSDLVPARAAPIVKQTGHVAAIYWLVATNSWSPTFTATAVTAPCFDRTRALAR